MRRINSIFLGILAGIFLVQGAYASLRETPVVMAVRKVAPAVVNIHASRISRTRPRYADPFFDDFFRDFFEGRRGRAQTRQSLGSGVIINGREGFILTNAHVVEGSDAISVTLMDGTEIPAAIIGTDPDTDLAVLKIAGDTAFPEAELGTSRDLMLGETVIAIGNPFGYSGSVTTGVISAVDRHVRANDRIFRRFIQTDASINPGNSGGPLLNIEGSLIGINTAILAQAQGIGFAIPIDRAMRVARDLIEFGTLMPIWIGLSVQDPEDGLSDYLGIPESGGVIVRRVEKGSPAKKAGLKEGDVLIRANGVPIAGLQDWQDLRDMQAAGERLELAIVRAGKREKTLQIEVTRYPVKGGDALIKRVLGIRIEEDGYGVRLRSVSPDSALGELGAAPGDRITAFAGKSVRTKEDFLLTLIRHRFDGETEIAIRRGNRSYRTRIPLR